MYKKQLNIAGNIRYYFYDYLPLIFIIKWVRYEKEGNTTICN